MVKKLLVGAWSKFHSWGEGGGLSLPPSLGQGQGLGTGVGGCLMPPPPAQHSPASDPPAGTPRCVPVADAQEWAAKLGL